MDYSFRGSLKVFLSLFILNFLSDKYKNCKMKNASIISFFTQKFTLSGLNANISNRIPDVPEQYKIPKVFPTSQTYVNRTFATKSFGFYIKVFRMELGLDLSSLL